MTNPYVGPSDDHYGRGWEAGLETARRILCTRLGAPEEALHEIQGLLVEGYGVRAEYSRAQRRRGGR
jgi:hypothetical protein